MWDQDTVYKPLLLAWVENVQLLFSECWNLYCNFVLLYTTLEVFVCVWGGVSMYVFYVCKCVVELCVCVCVCVCVLSVSICAYVLYV